MKIVAVVAGSGILLAGALLVSACGGSSGGGGSSAGGGSAQLTVGQEYPAMKAAMKAATSVRMSGDIVQGGKQISLDMALVKPGSAAGSVSQGGTSYTIVVTPDKDYIKISKAFLQISHLPAKVCAKACGKYLEVPAAADPSFSDLNMGSLINSVVSKPPSKSEKAIKLTSGQYQGQPALVGTGGGETFYIAKGSVPYLLAITKQGQSVSFSDWNTATVTPPPASKVLTAAQLGTLAAG
jgi:hypothetical protein